jgi:eukaryotic-like serine/threonine-protein kinase
MTISVGDVIGGDIRLDAEVGSGGFATVYRGVQLRLERRVAVKVLELDGGIGVPEAWALFEREAILLGRLKHPQIVDIYTMGVHDGVPYIVMEWLSGESLDRKLEREGPFTEERALKIVEAVARPLAKAHELNLVHRDIKPENIFEMPDGTIKLIDFGLGRPFGMSERGELRALAGRTMAGQARGTPHYMSPEQAAGAEVDHRTDIYALGVVLYELLSGRTPFGDAEVGDLESLVAHIASRRHHPTDISIHRPDVGDGVRRLIGKATAFAPEDRFADVAHLEFAARLILQERGGASLRGTPRALPAAPSSAAENRAASRHAGSGGVLEISHPAENVVVAKLGGHFGDELLGHYLDALDAAAERGAVAVGFHDWAELTSYAPACRRALTDWMVEHRGRGARHHVLVTASLAKMAIATARLMTGGDVVTSYEERAPFEDALHRTVRRRRTA